MTDNEYQNLLSIYYNGDYCMCMDFQEFLNRYADKFLEVRT